MVITRPKSEAFTCQNCKNNQNLWSQDSGKYFHYCLCSTEYQSECETLQEEHDVEDDVVTCETVVEEKCEDETSGYTTNTKCSKWPREVCNVQKTAVKKFTPETRCQKVPVELCGPAGNFK